MLRATTPGELALIEDTLHDEYVDVDAIVHDPVARAVRVPVHRAVVGRFRVRRADPSPSGSLHVARVRAVRVVDRAGIGTCDVNTLRLRDGGRLELVSAVPCRIEVDVHELDVTLEWDGLVAPRRSDAPAATPPS